MEKSYGDTAIENNELITFDNRTLDNDYIIQFSIPEFTCLCPRSGFPDFATIYINYIPDKKCVELKSLKLYINAFRDDRIFHEDVTNLILGDLVKLLDPKWVQVVSDFNVRGNIHTLVKASKKKDNLKQEDLMNLLQVNKVI